MKKIIIVFNRITTSVRSVVKAASKVKSGKNNDTYDYSRSDTWFL